MRDPYEILGLTPSAGAAEIKSAYRRLAKRYHPDAQGHPSGAAKTRFQEVTAAYNLLKDAAARARFDEERRQRRPRPKPQQGAAAPENAAFRETPFAKPSRPAESAFEATRETDAEKPSEALFSELFEGLRSAGKRVFRARGQDRTYRLSISFVEAAMGARKRVTLDGGRVLDIRIPAGVEQGRQIRLRGQGEEGHGGAEAGDALIEIGVEPHPRFRREGLDIHLTLPVTLPEAVLGAKVEVPTVSGPVALTIPAGSNTGTRLRLKGKGIAAEGRAASGDQYVTLQLVLPDTQDQELRDFAGRWAAGRTQDPRRDL